MAARPSLLGGAFVLAFLVRMLLAKPADGMNPTRGNGEAGGSYEIYKCPRCGVTARRYEGDRVPRCQEDGRRMRPAEE